MNFEYDPNKNTKNIERHQISFDDVAKFDFDNAYIIKDTRKDYGEQRFIAIGFIDNRLYVLCFVIRNGIYRIISLRKANRREVIRYEQTFNQ